MGNSNSKISLNSFHAIKRQGLTFWYLLIHSLKQVKLSQDVLQSAIALLSSLVTFVSARINDFIGSRIHPLPSRFTRTLNAKTEYFKYLEQFYSFKLQPEPPTFLHPLPACLPYFPQPACLVPKLRRYTETITFRFDLDRQFNNRHSMREWRRYFSG